MAFSLLLLRSFSPKNTHFPFRILSLFTRSTNGGTLPHFSSFHTETDRPKLTDSKPTLSARLSFVFDQIDEIEKDRTNKDEALQRIRAWRETKTKTKNNETQTSELNVVEEVPNSNTKKENLGFKKEVEVVHPWPEWVELMERLVQQNYFDHRRTDEDKIVQDLSIDVSNFPEEKFDFSRDWTAVRTACLNFGRDRFDILRSLSRKDIQILVGHGCPSTDRKVVFSGKILRKYVHIDEGDVCSSCNLRSSCEKAYLLSRKEDEARTLDVMRILLSYGFDPIDGTVENKSLLKMRSVKTVVRKLLHEVVKLSAVPIDPNLPPPVIKKPPPKVKQPPPPPRKRVGRDDIEMKKGDWLCTKCDFMNFAKNTVCLQCDAKRPKRQLLPGEWECPECNFLNYRRNMACFHCDHKRPPDEFMENQAQARQHGPRTRLDRVADMPAGSNSWNFDFDDNESDGADVAAFEYADPPRIVEDSPIESHGQSGHSRGYEDDSFETRRMPGSNGRGRYSDLNQRKSATGFDDFDDEEDDDVDSYELETPNNSSMREASRDFSEVAGYSESDDFDGPGHHGHAQRGANSSSSNMRSRSLRKGTFSGSDDDVEDLDSYGAPSGNSSSHRGDSRNGIRGRGRNSSYSRGSSIPNRGSGFGSDSELDIDSDSDGDLHSGVGSNQSKRNKWSSNKTVFGTGESSDSEDGLGFGSESDDYDLDSRKSKFGGTRPVRREKSSRSSRQFESPRGEGFRSNVGKNDRWNSFDNADRGRSSRSFRQNNRESSEDGYGRKRFSYSNSNSGRSSQDSFRSNRGSNVDDYVGRRANDKKVYTRNSDRDRSGEGRGYRKNGRSSGFNNRSEMARDFSDDDRPRRIIERTQPVNDWN